MSAQRLPQVIPFPSTAHRSPEGRRPRASSWRVIHACERARDVLPVVEGQIAVGMRPYVVTPTGGGAAEVYLMGIDQGEPRPLSLLRCWQDVRNWRRSLLGCDPELSADLVHAHSFTAGMAAVRSCACVVYDLHDCVEDFAIATGQCEPGSWIGRSFRAAEQFIVGRVAAVIVHSLGLQKAAENLGALRENIFVIPDPLPHEDAPVDPVPAAALNPAPRTVNFLVPQLTGVTNECNAQAARVALEAFARAIHEVPRSRLVMESHPGVISGLEREAARLGIAGRVFLLDAGKAAAWQVAHIVLAFAPPGDSMAALHPNPACLKAMRNGLALLAADAPPNRDVSPEGRGCIWFDPKDSRDLGCRMAFLAANTSFRRSLGNSGRLHLLETRNIAAIGRKYAEAYRRAASRRKPAGKGPGVVILRPAASCG